MPIDRSAPRRAALGELPRAIAIPRSLAACLNGALQAEQQAIEVNRDDLGGVRRSKRARIREPAGAEVPAALGGGANVPIELCWLPAARPCQRRILPVRLVPRCIPIVPIATQNRAVLERDGPAVAAARCQARGAVHPEGIFLLELRQVRFKRLRRLACGQKRDQLEEKRRQCWADSVAKVTMR